ncbi:MAG: phytoene/squalene synthase family protein [Bacteroidetes bacterium]|nr:phytoene/squalene synthase family protein [Bacteroidota bacterium]
MMNLFHAMSLECGRVVTEHYSTSFASSVRLLHRDLRDPIYSIYGFVRLADEIVDTFHDQDKQLLLSTFRLDTYTAIRDGISLNPILHGFQLTARKYRIDATLIGPFFASMETDIEATSHDRASYSRYIFGSAEAVGLMCLRVFCEGDDRLYQHLAPYARSLGAAFQKVNFLRDLGTDYRQLDRNYFPGCDNGLLTEAAKQAIEKEILADFQHARKGISQLPEKARMGVFVAYRYYYSLFKKIRAVDPARMLEQRIRLPNYRKWFILLDAGLRLQLKQFQ